jgi:hypothetical protein
MAGKSMKKVGEKKRGKKRYDVLSINENGLPRYIEAKTTSGSVDTPFYMSNNEKRFFEEYGDSAFIYRVYNFKRETRHGEVKIISQSELLSNYKFDPVTWLVTHIKPQASP